jgi:hypothetical protein
MWEGKPVGGILSLGNAWKLARAWYHDRLSPDWRRKPLAETQQLFSDLGLRGPFWQLRG